MGDIRLGPVESRFADLIWANEPLASSQLVQLAQQELQWKKSTTITETGNPRFLYPLATSKSSSCVWYRSLHCQKPMA